jgi:hypothetical protein
VIPIGDTLAAMGSRLAIIFDPVGHRILYPRYGEFDEIVADLAIGVRLKSGKTYALPFTDRYNHFEFVEQTNTMNSITYTGYAPDLGVRLVARFTSPFYPRDEKLSTAPILLVDLYVERLERYRWRQVATEGERVGEMFVEIESPKIRTRREGPQLRLKFRSQPHERRDSREASHGGPFPTFDCEDFIFPHTGGMPLRAEATAKGFVSSFDLRRTARSRTVQLTWCAFATDAVLELFGTRYPFKYFEFFKTEDDLIQYVILDRYEILCRSAFFDALFQETGLGKTCEDLVAFAFHSYLLNTWWTLWENGRDWFSVWEGNCYFHSTLDVEYNDALVYLALWPELLERLLEQWTRFERSGVKCLGRQRGAAATYLDHDMGSGGRVGEQHYHHPMEVEETCNYLLLAHTHWRWTTCDAIVKRHYKMIKRLAHFLVAADTTGNGVPDKGVANTIDDAAPAVQFGREQVYLGFKTLAALEKAGEIADYNKDSTTTARLRKQAATLRSTLDAKGWLVDHYAVTLGASSNGMVDAWKGKPVRPQELTGWDAYSIYTANGLLYPHLVGAPVRVNTRRIGRDLITAMAHSLTEYGCTHTSECAERVWISQNLWRDLVAAYMGIDLLNNADRYWAYQIAAGRNRPVTGYFDTVGNNLAFYPRGITAIGAFFAACRFQLDRVAGRCRVDPLSERLDLPLLALARWDMHQVPRLSVHRCNQQRHVRVSYRNCLRGLDFAVNPPA